MKITVGENTIDVTLGVVAVNGYGGDPTGLNQNWLKDPAGHSRRLVSSIVTASGRYSGWEHKAERWAFKPWGVNVAAGKDAAPYLAPAGSGLIAPEEQDEMLAVVASCPNRYIGSTWSGDNRESPRALVPEHSADLAEMFRHESGRPRPRRVCFDQAAALLGDEPDADAFERIVELFAVVGVTAMVEALPKSPRDLEWVAGFCRYAFLADRGYIGETIDAKPRVEYVVPRRARLVVLFDGMVGRDRKGEITIGHVAEVVWWAAAYGAHGYGARELELLIGSRAHAKAVVDWAGSHGLI